MEKLKDGGNKSLLIALSFLPIHVMLLLSDQWSLRKLCNLPHFNYENRCRRSALNIRCLERGRPRSITPHFEKHFFLKLCQYILPSKSR